MNSYEIINLNENILEVLFEFSNKFELKRKNLDKNIIIDVFLSKLKELYNLPLFEMMNETLELIYKFISIFKTKSLINTPEFIKMSNFFIEYKEKVNLINVNY